MFDQQQLKDLVEKKKQKQDIRFRCLEIAAQMLGPKELSTGITVKQILDCYLPLSNVIELHVTGEMPNT